MEALANGASVDQYEPPRTGLEPMACKGSRVRIPLPPLNELKKTEGCLTEPQRSRQLGKRIDTKLLRGASSQSWFARHLLRESHSAHFLEAAVHTTRMRIFLAILRPMACTSMEIDLEMKKS